MPATEATIERTPEDMARIAQGQLTRAVAKAYWLGIDACKKSNSGRGMSATAAKSERKALDAILIALGGEKLTDEQYSTLFS